MKKQMKRLVLVVFFVSCIIGIGCLGEETTNINDTIGVGAAPQGTVQGFVRDFKTNLPIKNVTVTLYAGAKRTTMTDTTGHWYFENVPAEDDTPSLQYDLTAPDADNDNTADYLPMTGNTAIDETADNDDVGAADESVPQVNGLVTVTDYMVGTATVSGFVRDAESGFGINGATVVLLNSGLGSPLSRWVPGASNASVWIQTQTATSAIRTEGGDGYYSLTGVPALTIAAGNLGAYASGYEYSLGGGADGSAGLNLRFNSAGLVDFALSPLDNTLGLVNATLSVVDGTNTNMVIVYDAAGVDPTAAAPGQQLVSIDLASATQLKFTLVFDQAIDTTHFYNDSIQLFLGATLSQSNLTPSWSNAYTVTLTAQLDLIDTVIGTNYVLGTNTIATRLVTSSTTGQTIASGTGLAQFHVYNSSRTPTNPTPALYLNDAEPFHDNSIVGEADITTYDASDYDNITTAGNYTGTTEFDLKNPVTVASSSVNTYPAAIDVSWTDTMPIVDLTSYNVWYRVITSAGEVIGGVAGGWTDAAGTFLRHDNEITVTDLVMTVDPETSTGTLRNGNSVQVATTITNTLGVQTAISSDSSKYLVLTDVRSPELAGLSNASYQEAFLTFSERMNTATAATVTPSNTGVVTTSSPTWEETDALDSTQLKLNPAGVASFTVSTTDTHTIDGAGTTITMGAADTLNVCYVGQILRLDYGDGELQDVAIGTLNTNTATPGLTLIAAATGNIVNSVAVTVSPTNTLRTGFTAPATALAATTITVAGAMNVAVGDQLIVRDTSSPRLASDVTVTVTDVDSIVTTPGSTVISVTIATGAIDTTEHDTVVSLGDQLTVVASDEAGNAMHSDANQIVDDPAGIFPVTAAAAGDAIF